MITSLDNTRTFVSSSAMSTDHPLFARTVTQYISLTRDSSQRILIRSYLRLGHLVIRPLLVSSAKEDSVTWRNTLICLAIFRRFMLIKPSKRGISSPRNRLSGLFRFHMNNYETFTLDQLLNEVFGTLRLQDTLLYQLTLLLRIDLLSELSIF